MEHSLPCQFNPGPPFAVSDIVLCDVEEFEWQKGFITRAEHPTYIVGLENCHVGDTAVSSASLIPNYAEWEGNTNDFATYVVPPLFLKLREELGQMGSFGVHLDAQQTALRLVD